MISDDAEKADPAHQAFRAYRAPKRDGEVFVDPPVSSLSDLIASNVRSATEADWPGDRLRLAARSMLIRDAIDYTSAYRDVDWARSVINATPKSSAPILMAGHQPELFHPGVWFKNFALSHWARQTGAVAINLVIDNDVASEKSVRVPSLRGGVPHAKRVVFDAGSTSAGIPFEETRIRDRDCFDSFDSRLRHTLTGLVDDPLVGRLWPHARAALRRCDIAGCALAQARHALEGEIGLRTLEVPMAAVCRSPSFATFVLRIVSEIERFQRIYNRAADAYRVTHRIRSAAHPVPNLKRDGDWYEVPLWMYGHRSSRRRSVWVRRRGQRCEGQRREGQRRGGQDRLWGQGFEFADREGDQFEVDRSDATAGSEQFLDSLSVNRKIRPRALLTTMYARMVLSDGFLHGIGGGKYDQLGDRILTDFFGLPAPGFMVVSATVTLSPDREAVDAAAAIRAIDRQIRDTTFNPDRFAHHAELDQGLMDRKANLIEGGFKAGQKKRWHDELQRINVALSASLDSVRRELIGQRDEARRRLVSDQLMNSREHPFCIYPLDRLRKAYERMLGIDESL